MFTPASHNNNRIRPWIVLVVVSAETCTLEEGNSERLAVLHVKDISAELPDLSQTYAWAHAQVATLADLDSLAN